MKIDLLTQTPSLPIGTRPLTPMISKRAEEATSESPAGRDAYARPKGEPGAEAPFWLLAMVSDRRSQRQFLCPREKRAAGKLESAWIQTLGAPSARVIAHWAGRFAGAPGLEGWQALATGLAGAAGFEAPRVVYQAELKGGRGQFLFRLEGNLIQLAPQAPGSLDGWAATVAHETFHHFQQALITALYKGAPLPDSEMRLAAYYRDSRNAYQALGAACPPEVHRRQDLERGAWAYGAMVKAHLLKNLSHA